MSNFTNLHTYLDFVSQAVSHPTAEKVVLTYGQQFQVPDTARPKGIRKMTSKLCYSNTYEFVVSHPGYHYVEGFALTSGIPILHAWAVEKKSSRVVDLTWETTGDEYFGLILEIPFINPIIYQTGLYGILPSLYIKEVWKIFSTKYPL